MKLGVGESREADQISCCRNDVMEDFGSLRHAAMSLIRELCWRRATTCLVPTLDLCITKCSRRGQGLTAQETDGVLFCIGEIADLIVQVTVWLLPTPLLLPAINRSGGFLALIRQLARMPRQIALIKCVNVVFLWTLVPHAWDSRRVLSSMQLWWP